MKKWLNLFKNLPPEIRMLIALAGFGTPAAIIYGLKRWLFPRTSTVVILFCVIGVIAIISGISFLVSKGFKGGGKRRARRMESTLAGEGDRGPVSIDVRAAIKSNNEKFFTAIREMRKNVGISVYDLPWYVVIGDSGCGKTKLVNEGGLTFSTGKPEGYQLGTLNYNWWFTEDAIFVDMAGRLCNPQDDADRREWLAFLDTVAKGRKGFPINGVLVCVSAEHLLADPPEKHEADANTTLERLRDLQTRLGVTFATYMIVTKCDKIPGFMQFYDRAERDITVKNQIFGWSKPGEFNELRDPEAFVQDFNSVYGRLNELRLRRLNDDADEIDLGLAYGFPEEFRQLREPLNAYVRTLFPMIRNPRAIKNLIFRGVYFTSATQEGELILRHLTERLGPDAADQFPRLDLYPNKRPHFIKDLLFRKVFPEQGLVFRNEQQAVRNKSYSRLLRIGSVALFVTLFGLLGLSFWKFGAVIGTPRDDAIKAHKAQPEADKPPAESLAMATSLHSDRLELKSKRFWASILSWGVGTDQPVKDLATIQTRWFEKFLLRPALGRIDKALRESSIGGEVTEDAYIAALEHYLCWLGCAGAESPPECVNFEAFKAMYRLAPQAASLPADLDAAFQAQAEAYFQEVKALTPARNPAKLLLQSGDPADTVRAAVTRLARHLEAYTRLDQGHPNKPIAEWMRIRNHCAAIESSYGRMLGAGAEMAPAATLEQLRPVIARFVGDHEQFEQGVGGSAWGLRAASGNLDIPTLRSLIDEQRKIWRGHEKRLSDAYTKCSATADAKVSGAIAAISAGSKDLGLAGLDPLMWEAMKKAELAHKEYNAGEWWTKLDQAVHEIHERYPHVIGFQDGGATADDQIVLSPGALKVKGVLAPIAEHLRGIMARLGDSTEGSSPRLWADQLEETLANPSKEVSRDPEVAALAAAWRPADLDGFRGSYSAVIDRVVVGATLRSMRARLGSAGGWGLAELYGDAECLREVPSTYDLPMPSRTGTSGDRRTESAPADQPATDETRFKRPTLGPGGTVAPAPQPAEAAPVARGDKVIAAICSRAFFYDCMADSYRLLYDLASLTENYYLAEKEAKPLHLQCRDLVDAQGRAYVRSYMRAWAIAYQSRRLAEADRLLDRAQSWGGLKGALGGREGDRGGRAAVRDEFVGALSEVLANVAFWDWSRFGDEKSGPVAYRPAGREDDRHWGQVRGWVQDALEAEWSSVGRFVLDAPRAFAARPGQAAPPWSALADEIAVEWSALTSAIEDNSELTREFITDQQAMPRGVIPWDGMKSARQEKGLDGEKLGGQLVEFEVRAQQLLSCELTNILVGIQDRHFRGTRSAAGWPYLDGAGGTVDLATFRSFLAEVERAKRYLAALEQKLPANLPQMDARRRFYAGCAAWEQFVMQAGAAQGLGMTVRVLDPTTSPECRGAIHDSAQQYYQLVKLNLGSEKPLDIPTSAGGGGATGTWSLGSGGGPLRISWTQGVPPGCATGPFPDAQTELGPASPLALCDYLRRHGAKRADTWVTCHGINMVEHLNQSGKQNLLCGVNKDGPVIGVALEFNLTRPMPEPISVMVECRSAGG